MADTTGPMNALLPCNVIAGALAFVWIRLSSQPAVLAFAVLYGFFSGSFVAMSAPVTASMCPHLGVLGSRNAMTAVGLAVGLLIGNPIAGALLKSGWIALQCFAGGAVFLSVVLLVVARVGRTGMRWRAVA